MMAARELRIIVTQDLYRCSACDGRTATLRDGLCRVCFDTTKRSSDEHDKRQA